MHTKILSYRRCWVKLLLVGVAISTASLQNAATAQTASLLINEVNPNLASSRDLLELLVVSPGTTQGITVEQAIGIPVILATLPTVEVATGDLIIVHNTSSSSAGTVPPSSETSSKGEFPTALYSGNYDTAWDVQGGTTGLTFTHRVLVVRSQGGAIQDAVPFVLTTTTGNSAFTSDLQNIQGQGLWLPPGCGGTPCTYASVPNAQDVSVTWNGVSTTPLGNSMQRKSVYDSNQSSDWELTPSTFGALNAAQSFLTIRSTNNTVVLSWSSSASLVLEETTNLVSATWSAAPAGNPTPPIPVTGRAKFYRLRQP